MVPFLVGEEPERQLHARLRYGNVRVGSSGVTSRPNEP
jgi:hypothetical protein